MNINKKTVHDNAKFRKDSLTNMPFYDANLTEYDIMKLNGYERIWDSGHVRYVLS